MGQYRAFGEGLALEATQEEILAEIQESVGKQLFFDYYLPAGSGESQIRYLGKAPQGTLTSDPTWTVKRLTWVHLGTTDKITEIQTLVGSWDDRDELPWV